MLLNELKESRNELLTQLEDERKKNEDWQFKFEEAEITRADLEVSINCLVVYLPQLFNINSIVLL